MEGDRGHGVAMGLAGVCEAGQGVRLAVGQVFVWVVGQVFVWVVGVGVVWRATLWGFHAHTCLYVARV